MSGDELARVEQTNNTATLPAAVGGYANDALRELAEWALVARSVSQMVAPLIDTPFVPDNYRPKIDPRATDEQKAEAHRVAIATATAAVLQGGKLGFDPITSLQQIIITHGRPSMYALAMTALLTGRGHKIWDEVVTDHRVVVCGRRRGEEDIVRIEVTMDMARKAGWTRNEAYGKTPRDMLWARAATRVCKRVAPEVLLGIDSIEEVEDSVRASAQAGTGRRVISPPQRPAVTAAPDPVDELLTDETSQAKPAIGAQPSFDTPLDPTQWRHINDELRRLGINGERQQARRLERIEQIVKRAIGRGSDLTYEEGAVILGVLRAEPTPGDERSAADEADEAASEDRAAMAPFEPTGDALLDDDWPPTARPPDATPDTPEEATP